MILSFMRSDKSSTCMVNRQRQSVITHNGSKMIMFSRFASVLQIAFSKKPPNVVTHHVFVILSLVTTFRVQYILMKALALLLCVSSHVVLEFLKMSVEDMDFERHSASHFGIILDEGLNQLHIVFSLVITQEAMNNCNETVSSHFPCPVQQRLANSSQSMIFLICGTTKIPALTFASDSFGKRSWRYLKAADSLSRAMTNCL